ncbi:MAG: DUF2946 family protein [Burkholderiales bacterium]|nr:DUF2946 family protein [Burkholderiales bacterium]
MDDIVAQAMARWPEVPAVYGWLRLDRRGRWLVKDEPIGHRPTVDFIGRNYMHDDQGRFFFQNGPQRVFVDIDHLPYVLRLEGVTAHRASLLTHTGASLDRPIRAWLDPDGGVIVEFQAADGPACGALLDRDLPALVDCFADAGGKPLDDEAWHRLLEGRAPGTCLAIGFDRIPVGSLPPGRTFPFVRRPRPAPGEEACT